MPDNDTYRTDIDVNRTEIRAFLPGCSDAAFLTPEQAEAVADDLRAAAEACRIMQRTNG